eukprot:CCRYP_016975-RA/>CCRYP_016975-RA protein AED:0.06 eAED:0.06 QI:150/1/1/1/1/1/3/558/994
MSSYRLRDSQESIDYEDDRIETTVVDITPTDCSGLGLQEQDANAQQRKTIELRLSAEKQVAGKTSEIVPSIIFPPSQSGFSINPTGKTVLLRPSLQNIDDDEAPIPTSQGTPERKEVKTVKGIEVLNSSDACLPRLVSSYDDSLSRIKQKAKENVQVPAAVPLDRTAGLSCEINDGSDEIERNSPAQRNVVVPDTTHIVVIAQSHISDQEDSRILAMTPPARPTETTAATTITSDTIFDAFSQRASTFRFTEGDEIFIPEATVVEESNKDDIPSAEIVVPEKYSITVAGRKVHAGVLVLVVVVIVVLVVGLSVSLKRHALTVGATVVPSISTMPSQPPSVQPSYNPSSELHSSLMRTIYGDEIDEIEHNPERKAAIQWLEKDQASYNSTALSVEELRERYALALLYFTSNAEGSWYDAINFLSDGHICTWRMKRSGEKKGVLLCNEEDRVLQLVLYSNSLKGTLPTELCFLSELEVLRLDSNRIESTIPDEIGSLSMLSQLILNGNGLTGTIPQTIVDLANLTDIYLSDNMLRGALFDVESFHKLKDFRVDGNILTGEVPSSFADIGFLDFFHINRNRLVGSIDFMCNNLPYDYKIDCDGISPEVICTCCIGCTIVGDDECDANEELALVTISSGNVDDSFSWQLYEITTDEFKSLIAAGGEYDSREQIYFQLCLSYPGKYYFVTQSNSTIDTGAGIDVSIGESDVSVGPQDELAFLLHHDGSLEVVLTTPSPTPSNTYLFLSDDSNPAASASESLGGARPGESSTADYFTSGSCFSITMQLKTDYFGDESSWEIVNVLNGAVVASAPQGYYQSNSTYYEYQCLSSDGCYNFTIFDQWSDGICCESGSGWFNLSVNDRFLYQGGNFEASDTVVIGGSCALDVPISGACQDYESPINVTILTDKPSWEMSWEVFDGITGQIYFLSDVMEENSLQTTTKCIPKSNCIAFAIYDLAGDGFNETSGGFIKVTYDGDLVAMGSGNFGFQNVSYFGTDCK